MGLSYDALGRLASAGPTRFVYDGPDLVAEIDASGAVTKRYVHGPGDDEPLLSCDVGGRASACAWTLADERGSVVGALDAVGAVTAIARFDDYGQGAPLGRFGFTGQAWLPEAGVYHYKARAYSPTLGRFLQPDPIGYADGMNVYRYVGNDPADGTDPSGLADSGTTVSPVVVCPRGSHYFEAQDRCVRDYSPNGGTQGASGGNGGGGLAGGGGGSTSSRCFASTGGAIGLLRRASAFVLGVDDAVTLGLFSRVLGALPGTVGGTTQAQTGSPYYSSGLYSASALAAGRLAYAAVASTFSFLDAETAVANRNALKGLFSGLGDAHPRTYTLSQARAKYGSDAEISAAASRTNPQLNGAAKAVALSPAAVIRKC